MDTSRRHSISLAVIQMGLQLDFPSSLSVAFADVLVDIMKFHVDDGTLVYRVVLILALHC